MIKPFWTETRRGLAVALGSAIVFGYWPTAVRGIYAEGGNVVFALLVTIWARALSLVGFCALTRRPLFGSRRIITSAVVGGIFQAICVLSLLTALLFLPGPIVIIILFSHTLMLLFYMAWRGELQLDRATVLTTMIALFGLSLVLHLWQKQSVTNIWGFAIALVAALTTVSRLYIYGRQTKERHPIVVGAENFIIAAILISFTAFYEAPVIPSGLAGCLYTGTGCVAMVLGTFGMFYGISMLGSFKWSLFAKLEPVFTALFSALVLREYLAFTQYLGVMVVLGSLIFYQIMEHRKSLKSFVDQPILQ